MKIPMLQLLATLLVSANAMAQAPAPPAAPAPAPAPPVVDTIWSCKVARPETAPPLTVGEKFTLTCEGPSIALDRTKLGLDLAKEQKWALKILETKMLNETSAEFVATTWVAGDLRVTNPVLTDGTKRVSLGEIAIQVASVIDEKKNPEKKPFGPWSALKLSYPIWLWATLGALALALIAVLVLRLSMNLRRKKLLRLLAKNPIALSPYDQFNKDLRKLQRQIPSTDWNEFEAGAYFRDLDGLLRWYLARTLVVSVFDRSVTDISREVKRVDRKLFELIRRDLFITMTELEKARSPQRVLSTQDAQQLTEITRQFADRIEKQRSA